MSHDFCPNCHKDAADARKEYAEAMSIGPLENTLRISDGSTALRYSCEDGPDTTVKPTIPFETRFEHYLPAIDEKPSNMVFPTSKYSQYPGERLFKSVEFVISGRVVDYHGTCDCGCGCRAKFQLSGGWNEGEKPESADRCSNCNWRCKLLNKNETK